MAFSKLYEIEEDLLLVDYNEFNERYNERDAEARNNMRDLINKYLWAYFIETDKYSLKPGKALDGFMPEWIGEFYAYYQRYYNLTSSEIVRRVPVSFLKKGISGTSRPGS